MTGQLGHDCILTFVHYPWPTIGYFMTILCLKILHLITEYLHVATCNVATRLSDTDTHITHCFLYLSVFKSQTSSYFASNKNIFCGLCNFRLCMDSYMCCYLLFTDYRPLAQLVHDSLLCYIFLVHCDSMILHEGFILIATSHGGYQQTTKSKLQKSQVVIPTIHKTLTAHIIVIR